MGYTPGGDRQPDATVVDDLPLARIVSRHLNLRDVVSCVLERWPEHESFLKRSIGAHDSASLEIVDEVAAHVLALAGDDLPTFCDHYRWMCDMVNEEVLPFLRSGEYRCKTFAEAAATVYFNKPFMEKYMNGLLLSQALWFNHARTYIAFKRDFLPALEPQAHYLEIGPGHGLFLAQAATDPGVARVCAWDVSEESLRQTAQALTRLGVTRRAELIRRDVLAAGTDETFDAIVISEVLEHLEEPRRALEALIGHLGAAGKIFINVPVNSPAPDHIFLLRTTDEAVQLVESAGLRILERSFEPMSGYTLKRAIAFTAAISCIFVAERAA